ncbi:MAG: HAD-IIA family hydrolase [Clostridia bacterium]|nr:HAD-IIA family hydrolase [Clostridia bacterium]
MNFKDKKLYLLDMDGTIYLGNTLFPFTLEFIKAVKENGARCMYLTNNSSKGVSDYVIKLKNLGIDANKEDFVTSTDATAKYLLEKGYKRIYAMGTPSFVEHLKSQGLSVTEEIEDEIDCVCLAFDSTLTFKKIEDVCKILCNKNVAYVATHPDLTCPMEYGSVVDLGSLLVGFYNATGKNPVIIGKPEPTMIELAIERAGVKKEQAVMIGDRLKTDVLSGLNADIDSILVLTGEDNRENTEKYKIYPTEVLNSIEEITKQLKK